MNPSNRAEGLSSRSPPVPEVTFKKNSARLSSKGGEAKIKKRYKVKWKLHYSKSCIVRTNFLQSDSPVATLYVKTVRASSWPLMLLMENLILFS